jgi:aminopeptidase N
LAFEGGIAYNLGIGLGESPYNFGRSWFPCFDNFVERSTFSLNIVSANGRKAYCSGLFVEEEMLEDDKIRRSYRIDQPLTTYLVGVAVADLAAIETSHEGQYGTYPIRLVASPGDLGAMDNSFEYLGDAIDELEHWYGPYRWGEVGYVLTPVGAMEHVNNIAFPRLSGVAGATSATNRLLAHELAHQWWGNITTLTSPANMWIKEGNAEYGAHLFTEYAFGENEFREQVKANHLDVLRTAHIDDDGFQPLSGIPYEQTYGTHTYYKGASMIHNMRAYLGDSLFRLAQSAVLNDFAFSAVDAEQYRDHLSSVSGIDMTPFFDDWIFSPGWSNFEKEAVVIEPMGDEYEVTLTVQQRVRASDHLHTELPLSVTFFAADWEEYTARFYASGEFSTVSLMVPFEPVMTILNHHQELNLGRVNQTYTITEAGNINASAVDFFTFTIDAVTDSALLNIVHHWTAPDPSAFPEQIEMSGTHYWSVDGIFPADFSMKSIIRYQGGTNDLDYDLVAEGNDFVRLMYRSTPDAEWEEYPFVTYTPFGSGGLARMEITLPGDYALANVYEEVSTRNLLEEANLIVSPNPAQEVARLQVNFPEATTDYELGVYDLQGRLVYSTSHPQSSLLDVSIPTNNLVNGMYVLTVSNGSGYRALELVVEH